MRLLAHGEGVHEREHVKNGSAPALVAIEEHIQRDSGARSGKVSASGELDVVQKLLTPQASCEGGFLTPLQLGAELTYEYTFVHIG